MEDEHIEDSNHRLHHQQRQYYRRCWNSGVTNCHMTAILLLLLLFLVICITNAMCPTRCTCNDDQLHTQCTYASLQVIPIQLNPELRHINLSHNRINSLHFTLDIYAQLKTLDITYNQIQKLGSFHFIAQAQLVTLNLSHNLIETLEKDVFKGLKMLELLDLSSNQLHTISKFTFNDLMHLKYLYLENNQLTSFDRDIFQYQTELQILQLNNNQFLETPNLDYNLAIQELYMSRNLIQTIHNKSLINLKSLRRLTLDLNVISDIENNAFDTVNLVEILNLANNNLTHIPTVQLSKLLNLVELNLSGNFFQILLPVAFRALFKLERLYLNNLDVLQRIDMRAFVDNICLKQLCLDNNLNVSFIPTRLFHGNPILTYLSIRNNRLSSLDASHFPLDQLKELYLGQNPFNCNCSLVWLHKLLVTSLNPINVTNELSLDVNQIKCASPVNLQNRILLDITESEIDCTNTWMSIVTGSSVVAICLFSFVLTTLFYTGMLRKRDSNINNTTINSTVLNSEEATSHSHTHPQMKCAHLCEYKWDEPTTVNLLHQNFTYHTTKPHIVYV